MAESKQVELQKIIADLAQETRLPGTDCENEYIEKFRAIYADDFRHLYSGIFGVIANLNEEQKVSLEQNLSLIYEKAKEQNDVGDDCSANLCKSLRKLHDHISLDISRMNYQTSLLHEYDERFNEAKRNQAELGKKISKRKKEVAGLVDKLEKAKNEYITILGIFAAIILGAVGSLTYAGKILGEASEQSADLTRLIIIAMVLGAVLVSVINTFLSFILKINGNNAQFKSWRWCDCMSLIFLSGLAAIGITKLLGV